MTLLRQFLAPRWAGQGRDCPRRGCSGQHEVETTRRSAQPGHRRPVMLPTIEDVLWSSTSQGDTVAQWTCTKCATRGNIKRHEVK
jgi:hypothetical protein